MCVHLPIFKVSNSPSSDGVNSIRCVTAMFSTIRKKRCFAIKILRKGLRKFFCTASNESSRKR